MMALNAYEMRRGIANLMGPHGAALFYPGVRADITGSEQRIGPLFT